MSPEWQNSGLITVKFDVYSFGVVLLEIACCKSNFEVNVSTADVVLLSTWVYNCFIAKELNKLVGEDEEVDLRTLETMVRVGLLCIQDEPNLCSSMKNVILMLEGTMEIPVVPFPILSNFNKAKERVRLVTGIGEVKKLNGNLLAFQVVLKDAKQRQMKDNKATARLKLQIKGFDDDNALALAPQKKKVCSFFPTAFCLGSFKQLRLRHDTAMKIKEINERFDDIATQKDRFKIVENVTVLRNQSECEPPP
ncbi:hypothetical protein WN943_000637 [Citrus x changshan-huyou]